MNVGWLGWVLVGMLGGCAATPPRVSVESSRPSAPVPSASSGTNEAVAEPAPCEKAAALRSRVPGWLDAGKLHRSLEAIEAANRLCLDTSTSIRIAELEILVELGRKAAAREFAGELSNGPLSPEERAAVDRALAALGTQDESPRDPSAFEGNMRDTWHAARAASREGRYADASSLLLEGWSKWNRADLFALIDAGRFALKAGKAADAQRLFDRGLEELERRYATTVRVELRRDLSHTGDMVWVPSTEFVAVVDRDDIVLVDGDTLKERLRWKAYDKSVSVGVYSLLVASPNGRCLASSFSWGSDLSESDDHLIRVWRASDGEPISTIQGPVGHVAALAISPDGKVVASVGPGSGVRLNRLEDGVLLRVLRGSEGPPRIVAFSPDGKLLASGVRDGMLRLFRLADGSLMREVKGAGEEVTGLAFFRDARTLLVGIKDGRFCRVRVEDGSAACYWKSGSREIRNIATIGNGPVVSAMTNDVVGLWDGTTGKPRGSIRRSEKATGYINAAFSPDEQLVVLNTKNGNLELVHKSSKDYITLDDPHDRHKRIVYDASGTMMASGAEDGTVWLWRARDGALLRRLSGQEKGTPELSFDSTGTFLASSSGDGSVRLWKTADGSLVRVFAEPGKQATSVTFAPDGKSLWAGFADGSLRRWSAPDGRLLDALDTKGDVMESIALSADGALVAVGTTRGRIQIWRTTDKQPVCSSEDSSDSSGSFPRRVTHLAFTPDGRRVAGINWSYDVNVWSTRDCRHDPSFKPPKLSLSDERLGMGRFDGFALSRGGTFLATNYGDGSVRLLSTRDGAELHSFKRDHNGVLSASIAPDDHRLLFATEQGLEVWNVDGTEPIHRLSTNREHDAIVTLSGSGRYFDIVGKGEPWALDNMAVCRIGPVSLPLEVCAERTRVPGLGAKLASVGETGIEP